MFFKDYIYISGLVKFWRCIYSYIFVFLSTSTIVMAATVIGPIPITGSFNGGLSPYNNPPSIDPVDCTGQVNPLNTVYVNSEAEPQLAVNPANLNNMVVMYMQDPWSGSGASGNVIAQTTDGGLTWHQVFVPFTKCSAALIPGSFSTYQRAADPWVTIGPTGKIYLNSLSDEIFNGIGIDDGGSSQLSATSTNGGASFADIVPIKLENSESGSAPVNDKNAMTADPFDPNLVYVVWARFQGPGGFKFPTAFSRTYDAGSSWDRTKLIYNASSEILGSGSAISGSFYNQIVVLPDRTLVNVFGKLAADTLLQNITLGISVIRSFDLGNTWDHTSHTVVTLNHHAYTTCGNNVSLANASACDYETGTFVRDSPGLPAIAVNNTTGDIYIAYSSTKVLTPTSGERPDAYVIKSSDAGLSWSTPVKVNADSTAGCGGDAQCIKQRSQAFLPHVAVADNGVVAVFYYDFRNDVQGDNELSTDANVALLTPNLVKYNDVTLTPTPFNLRSAPIKGDSGYFLGDYIGFKNSGNDFVAAVPVAVEGNFVGFPVDNSIFVRDDNYNRTDIDFYRLQQ